MKNLFFFLLVGLLLSARFAAAQAPDAARQQLDQIFAHVDKSQVPSAYLSEYGEQLLNLRPYNGVLTDSNRTDLEVFRYLRATIRSARVAGTDTLPGVGELNRRLDARRQGASGAPIALAVQYMTYHRLRPDALSQNLLSYSGGQLHDVAGRTPSPS